MPSSHNQVSIRYYPAKYCLVIVLEPTDPKYNFSSFEMAMVSNADDESQHQLLPPSRGGSGHASVASSKRTGKFK